MLKTNCKNCAFLTCGTCILNKDIFAQEETFYTKGYCHHKRNWNWLHKNVNKEIPEVLCDIASEESSFAAVISVLDNDLDKIHTTVDCLKKSQLIQEYVFGITKTEILKDVIEIAQSTKVKWGVFDIKNDECVDVQTISHYVMPNVTKHWVLSLSSGDTVNLDDIEYVAADLIYKKTNYVLYNLSDNKSIINKNVFIQLGGNNDTDIVTKIKKFPNWEQVCLTI